MRNGHNLLSSREEGPRTRFYILTEKDAKRCQQALQAKIPVTIHGQTEEGTPEWMEKFLRTEVDQWGRVIRAAGVSVE